MIFLLLSLFPLVASAPWVQSSVLNGHVYSEIIVQPFFRAHHPPHIPIPIDMLNTSDFGKHRLPKDDVFQPHGWSAEDEEYFACTNLLCTCGYFNGSVVGSFCLLPDGSPLTRAVRKEVRLLEDEEWTAVKTAFSAMRSNGEWQRLGLIHKYAAVHAGPSFATWHREFLRRAELMFRRQLPREYRHLGFPYWDSTMDQYVPFQGDSIFFTDLFVGETNKEGFVRTGTFANWSSLNGEHDALYRQLGNDSAGELISHGRLDWLMDQRDIGMVLAASTPTETCSILPGDERLLEYSHDYVHYFIGGDFGPPHSSAGDPIFYLHHSFIDHIWEMWREKRQSRAERISTWPVDDPNCYVKVHFIDSPLKELAPFTNRKALALFYTDDFYKYAPRPTCDEGCGKYAYCHSIDATPRCVSLIRVGGACEHEGSCYRGECRGGKCVAEENGTQVAENRVSNLDTVPRNLGM